MVRILLMSNEAITWAISLTVGRSSAKFVLVAMANLAGSDMTCWPSIKYLSDATDQDRKTVIENIKRLKDAGLIIDTKLRKGTTGQVPVYQLNGSVIGTIKPEAMRPEPVPKTDNTNTENGTIDPLETVPKTDDNSPVFPCKESRFSVEPVPKTDMTSTENGTRTPKDTKGTPKEPTPKKSGDEKYSAIDTLLAMGVDGQVVKDWIKHRKAKKASDGLTVVKDRAKQAALAGIQLSDALSMEVSRGWQGFESAWLVGKQQTASSKPWEN